MPAATGIRVVCFIPAQVNVASSTSMTSTGLVFANYGGPVNRNIYFRAFLRVQQAGAGGFRFRFVGLASSLQGWRKMYDPDLAAMTFAGVTNGSSQITYTPTGGGVNLIEYEGVGSYASQTSPLDFQFGQQTSDPGNSSFLLGSYIELTIVG